MSKWPVLILALLTRSVATPAVADPWEGLWAADPAWCANTAGETDHIPVRFSRSKIEGYESLCLVTNVTPIRRVRAWIVDSLCAAEGNEEIGRELLMLTQAGKLLRFTQEGLAIEMTPCDR